MITIKLDNGTLRVTDAISLGKPYPGGSVLSVTDKGLNASDTPVPVGLSPSQMDEFILDQNRKNARIRVAFSK